MTNYPKRKNDGTKSITLRREFWRSFKNDFRDSKNTHETQKFYGGYALGLFRAKRITEEQYNEMIKRLREIITWGKSKKKYSLKGGIKMHRWAIMKGGKEIGNLGWFTEDCEELFVLDYCKEKGIKIEQEEEVKIMEAK